MRRRRGSTTRSARRSRPTRSRCTKWMRDAAPVFHSGKWGWWALSRFDDVRAAATDPETFLSFEGIDIDDTAKDQSGPGFLPDIDNPRHDQIRRIVQPQLLPNRIAEREDAVRAVVRGLVDRRRDRGSVDLAQELAWPMPNAVFFDLLGLPATGSDRERLERWVHELKDRKPDDSRLTPLAKAATAGIQSYFVDLLHERRRHPRADLVTHLVRADIDGVPFAEEHIGPASETLGLMMVLFLGGVESTAELTATLFKLLAENPGQRALLREAGAFAARGAVRPAVARRAGAGGGVEVELARSGLTLTVPPERSVLEEGGGGGAVVLRRGDLRDVRDRGAERATRPSRLRADGRGAARRRLHAHLRVAVLHGPAGARPLRRALQGRTMYGAIPSRPVK